MKLVVDSSVAIKWAIKEDGAEAARALLRSGAHELIAPDFLLFELSNVLWKKTRRAEIGVEQARGAGPAIAAAFSRLLTSAPLVNRALELAIEIDHPVYDCLFVAAAQMELAPLVTADKRLISSLGRSQYAGLGIPVEAVT